MNTNTTQGNWNEIKDKIKSKWSKFSDTEIESFKGGFDQLSSKLQKAYGYPQDRADKECKEFKATLSQRRNSEPVDERSASSSSNQNQKNTSGPTTPGGPVNPTAKSGLNRS